MVGLLCCLGSWWRSYNLQSDEGLNLEKAALVANGYHLYQEIWSDQPPLLTYTLAFVHHIFPFSAAAARATILIFSIILATSLFRVVLRLEGPLAAWSSALFLISSELFLKLSVSVMIGLPAVALAMLAIDFATIKKKRWVNVLTISAGVLFAAAMLTKMFTAIVLPAILAALWFMQKREGKLFTRGFAIRLFWFLCGMAIIGAIFLKIFGRFPFDQLVDTHVSAKAVVGYNDVGGIKTLYRLLLKKAPLAFWFAIVSCFSALYRRRLGSSFLIPAVWFIFGIFILATHRPLWQHQVLILIPPLSWIGGIGCNTLLGKDGIQKFFNWMRRKFDRRLFFASAIFFVAVVVVVLAHPLSITMKHVQRYFKDSPKVHEQMVRLHASILSNGTEMLITDRPILAYQEHLLVPPKLAVWSEKRVKTGRLTENEILEQVAAYPDAPVLLDRFSYDRSFLDRISSQMDEIEIGFNLPQKNSHHIFLPKTTPSCMETSLLSKAQTILDGGIGGVFLMDGIDIKHFDRPASEKPLPENSIVARPPGSAQELGDCLTAAAKATDSSSLLIHALEIARALYCTQTMGGGWTNHAAVTGACEGRKFVRNPDKNATFDDGTVPSIIYFAFDLSDLLAERDLNAPTWLNDMIDNAFSFIIKTQSEEGSWPQQYKSGKYHNLATLNDDAMTGIIRVLVAGYERLGCPAYLEAARRAGDFLLKVQCIGDEPGFAQQYDSSFKPASARKFEPAGYSSLETAYAINALVDLYLSTSDERYRIGAQKAAAWLDSIRTTPTTWARLYEIGSNRPIFGKRDGTVVYDILDLPESERTTYRWTGGLDVFPDIGIALERIDKLSDSPDQVRDYDAQFRLRALLSATPTARIWLNPEKANQALDVHPSTRAFVEHYAGLLAKCIKDNTDL